MIEQGKFTYSHLGKALVKQIKIIEDQGKNQVKAVEDHGKQFTELVEERSSEFRYFEKRITADNFIHKYKPEGRSPKDFSFYKNLIDLFKNLRAGAIKPKKSIKKSN